MNALAALVASVSLLLLSGGELERPKHDHTLYIVDGDSKQLAKFHEKIGSAWDGGKLIGIDENTGQYTYWAFADRTAKQSRAFMMPAIFSGLELDIQAYEEAKFFPEHRTVLDASAVGCGLKHDPFFLSPAGLEITPTSAMSVKNFRCAIKKVKADDLFIDIPMIVIGEEEFLTGSAE